MVGLLQFISVPVTLTASYSRLCSTLRFWRFPPEPYSCASAQTADVLSVGPAESQIVLWCILGRDFSIFYSDLNAKAITISL